MVKPTAAYIKFLFPSFILMECLEFGLFYLAAPEFLMQSSRRNYIFLFFIWSGIIVSPILSMIFYSFSKNRGKKVESPKEERGNGSNMHYLDGK